MNQHDRTEVERIISAHGQGPGGLIPILLAIQEGFRYLPGEALDLVARGTAVTAADLAGVISFYPRFRTRPAGEHLIQVCVGTACHVRGAVDTSAEFRHLLRIPEGDDTDPDGLFTLEEVACLGCCMLAPAVRIARHTYGHVDAGRVPDVLSDFLSPSRQEAAPDIRPQGDFPAAGNGVAGEVRTCLCTSCSSAGAEQVMAELGRQIRALHLPVRLRSVGCTGISSAAPIVDVVLPSGRSWRYGRIDSETVRPLLLEHFTPGDPAVRIRSAVAGLLDRFLDPDGEQTIIRYRLEEGTAGEFSGHRTQVRKATEHAGKLDPLDMDGYIATGGFEALRIAAGELSSNEVIARIAASGLRGRGGAGYATGKKWHEVRQAPGDARYVVCNGDEGDPGAFMDRMILESFPFRVIEGMAIAGAAVGAEKGFLYVRGEYRRALERLRDAVSICTARGILGPAEEGRPYPFEITVFEGAGAYVCGEETALLESMAGRRGMPRVRPPFPSEKGLHGLPTLVNNVETFALVPAIIREGPESFAALGTASSRGTKSFALAGAIARGGLIEVPMGMPLREIVEEIGGLSGKRALKAIQVGGPSGGCVPVSLADTPVDYEELHAAGAIMGSGGMIVLDEGDCLVDLARYFTAFSRRESCGKCGACRIGTVRMLEILEDICEGRGRRSHLDRLEEAGLHMQETSLCGLGRSAPNTVLSTLRHFREEYLAHIDGACPAGRCKGLITYSILTHCIGCTRCAQRCPAGAIDVDPHQMHRIDGELCTRCDICRQVCPVEAVEVA